MLLTIIRDDNVVIVDGRALSVDLSGLPVNLHAVQWDGASGHIEYNDGELNEPLMDISAFAGVVAEWTAARDAADAPPPEPTLAELRSAKQAEIRDKAEAFLAPLKVEYGPTEIASWDTQKEEAKALLADPDAKAPCIRSASASRGMDPLIFAARVIANNTAWSTIAGHVVGQRLAYQDTLDATSVLADESAARAAIAAIVPVYTLPQAISE